MSLNIFVVGVGLVGKELLRQLTETPIPGVAIAGVCTSRTQLLATSNRPILASNLDWTAATPTNLGEIIQHLKSRTPSCLIDCSSSQEIAESYPAILSNGIHLIMANKKGLSGKLELYKQIMQFGPNKPRIGFESTVGAGLPIVRTLRELVGTGEKVTLLEGVLSGTLSYLWNILSPNTLDGQCKFSEQVVQAKELGFTEPDPRDDLSGLDVARKVCILARISGWEEISLEDVQVESLVPEQLRDTSSVAEFLSGLVNYDQQVEERINLAKSNRQVLRYVGSIDVLNRKATVGLKRESYDLNHPFAGLAKSDNAVKVTTGRSWPGGIVIQGAGAGAAPTAYGITSDLVRLLETLN